MKIDILIKYEKGNIKVSSEKTNITLFEPSMVLLMKTQEEEQEKIESVGASEDWLREEMKKYPEYNEGKVFRFLDPFNCETFDPLVSGRIIFFYCFKIRHLHLENAKIWQRLFAIYRFDLTICIPGYFSLPDKVKKDFLSYLNMWRFSKVIFL